MLHLLRLEWLKQRNYNMFRVMAILFLVAMPSLILIWKTINISGDDLPPFIPSKDSIYMFPMIWQWMGYIGNWLTFFFLGFLGVLMVTNEYSNKTLRQNIITGLTRKEYFLSKFYFIVAVALFATLYYAFWCLIYGFMHTDTIYLNTVMKHADYVPRFFLMSFGYMSFGLLVGLVIKRTGIALFLYLAYIMIIESILRYAVHMKLFQHKSMHFYPMNALEDLAPPPYLEMADGFAENNGFDIMLSPNEAIIASLVYISLFLLGSYRLLQRNDL